MERRTAAAALLTSTSTRRGRRAPARRRQPAPPAGEGPPPRRAARDRGRRRRLTGRLIPRYQGHTCTGSVEGSGHRRSDPAGCPRDERGPALEWEAAHVRKRREAEGCSPSRSFAGVRSPVARARALVPVRAQARSPPYRRRSCERLTSGSGRGEVKAPVVHPALEDAVLQLPELSPDLPSGADSGAEPCSRRSARDRPARPARRTSRRRTRAAPGERHLKNV